LRGSPAFEQALPLADSGAMDPVAHYVFEHRFDLLMPRWLDQEGRAYAASGSHEAWPSWLAERAAADLEAFLAKPEAAAFEDLVPSDPLLLLPGAVGRMGSLAQEAAGMKDSHGYALIWALARGSPFKEEGQGPLFAAVEAATARMRQGQPRAELRWTAVGLFAARSRARIESEMSWLNTLSLICVLAVAAACVRHVYRALHLAPVVLGSLLGAWVAVTAVWDQVHILVFVVGSLLAGVAVDYGFYIFLQPRMRPEETYADKARRLIGPLLASALTTVIGFSMLLASDLPLIRQLGVFVSAGLVSALVTALLWFAQIRNPYLDTRDFICWHPRNPGPRTRLAARALLCAGAVIAVATPWRLHWKDDIRELEIPTPSLKENDHFVRALFGAAGDGTVYLTRGATAADARRSLEGFLLWHAATYPGADAATIGYALPTPEEWQALPGRMADLGAFGRLFSQALVRHGFEPKSLEPFFTALEAWRAGGHRPGYEDLARGLAGSLKGPLGLLFQSGKDLTWFATLTEHPAGDDPPPATATASDSQLETLDRLFGRYRASALRLSAIGLGILGASVLVIYGSRRGIRIFAVPAGACFFAFGVLGLFGATLNLFHLLGAFLGVCLSHNYAIFSAESALRGEEPPPSIRMSGLAAAGSFGVLALSRIPVVAALGSTVALIVLGALAITELAPLAGTGIGAKSAR